MKATPTTSLGQSGELDLSQGCLGTKLGLGASSFVA